MAKKNEIAQIVVRSLLLGLVGAMMLLGSTREGAWLAFTTFPIVNFILTWLASSVILLICFPLEHGLKVEKKV